MRATLTLSKDEIDQAIKAYLTQGGWRAVGAVSLSYSPADPREPASYSASVQVESLAAPQPDTYR